MEVNKQKQLNKGKVEVNVRKQQQEENKTRPKEQPKKKEEKLSNLDKFNKMAGTKDDEEIVIDDEIIFKNAFDVSKANQVVGMNIQFTPTQQNKNTSLDAAPKGQLDLPMGGNPPENIMSKAKSEAVNKEEESNKKAIKHEEVKSPPVQKKSFRQKMEEDKSSDVPKQPKTPKDNPRPKGGGLMFSKNKSKNNTNNNGTSSLKSPNPSSNDKSTSLSHP